MGQASLNVAFFLELSAIATQPPKKQAGKQKPNEDHEDFSGYDPLYYIMSYQSRLHRIINNVCEK